MCQQQHKTAMIKFENGVYILRYSYYYNCYWKNNDNNRIKATTIRLYVWYAYNF